jgi:hypothetical protein
MTGTDYCVRVVTIDSLCKPNNSQLDYIFDRSTSNEASPQRFGLQVRKYS